MTLVDLTDALHTQHYYATNKYKLSVRISTIINWIYN